MEIFILCAIKDTTKYKAQLRCQRIDTEKLSQETKINK